MKRNFDLMRKILFELEDNPDVWVRFKAEPPEKEHELLLHLRLLEDIGCVELGEDYTARLTLKGYDILELLRYDGKWDIQNLIKLGLSGEILNNYIIAKKMKEKPNL